jgi:hypothetical protein
MEEIKRISEESICVRSPNGIDKERYIHPFVVEPLLPLLLERLNEVIDRVNG